MLTVSIFVFMILFGVIQYAKPSIFYNTDGSIRKFGVGYKNKTILPIWLFAIVLAILSYVGILYYLEYF
jgi:hypothetical protein